MSQQWDTSENTSTTSGASGDPQSSPVQLQHLTAMSDVDDNVERDVEGDTGRLSGVPAAVVAKKRMSRRASVNMFRSELEKQKWITRRASVQAAAAAAAADAAGQAPVVSSTRQPSSNLSQQQRQQQQLDSEQMESPRRPPPPRPMGSIQVSVQEAMGGGGGTPMVEPQRLSQSTPLLGGGGGGAKKKRYRTGGGLFSSPSPTASPASTPIAPRDRLLSDSDWWRHKITQDISSTDEGIKRAAQYITQSLHRGATSLQGATEWQLKMYYVRKSSWYLFLVRLAILLQMALVLVEPSSYRERENDRHQQIAEYLLGYLSISILYLDCYIRMVPLGMRKYVRHRWNMLSVVLITLNFLDLASRAALGSAFRFSRPFRPVLFIAQSRSLRRSLGLIIKGMPSILGVTFVFSITTMIFAQLGVSLFTGMYNYARDELPIGNFDSFSDAMLSLFVLTTTENYPDIMYPAFNHNQFYVIYFVIFNLIALFLGALLLAVAFDSYKTQHKAYVMEGLIKERSNFLAAFQVIDINHDGTVDFDEWRQLLAILEPNMREQEMRLLFEMLDVDESGELSPDEFCMLAEMLDWRFTVVDNSSSRDRSQQQQQNHGPLSCARMIRASWHWLVHDVLPFTPATAQWMTQHAVFNFVFKAIALANALCIAILSDPYGKHVGANRQHFSPADIVSIPFIIVFAGEQFLKVVGDGWTEFWRKRWNQFDFTITSIACVWGLFYYTGVVPLMYNVTVWRVFDIFRPRTKKSSLLAKLLFLDQQFGQFAHALRQSAHVVLTFGCLALFAMYSFAIVGMELFGNDYARVETINPNPNANFSNFGRAMLTLFQLVIVNNWHTIMYSAILATGSGFVSWYFISYLFIVVTVGVNLLVALIIESFGQQGAEGNAGASSEFEVTIPSEEHEEEGEEDRPPETLRITRRRRWSRELVMSELQDLNDSELHIKSVSALTAKVAKLHPDQTGS